MTILLLLEWPSAWLVQPTAKRAVWLNGGRKEGQMRSQKWSCGPVDPNSTRLLALMYVNYISTKLKKNSNSTAYLLPLPWFYARHPSLMLASCPPHPSDSIFSLLLDWEFLKMSNLSSYLKDLDHRCFKSFGIKNDIKPNVYQGSLCVS